MRQLSRYPSNAEPLARAPPCDSSTERRHSTAEGGPTTDAASAAVLLSLYPPPSASLFSTPPPAAPPPSHSSRSRRCRNRRHPLALAARRRRRRVAGGVGLGLGARRARLERASSRAGRFRPHVRTRGSRAVRAGSSWRLQALRGEQSERRLT